MNKSVLCGKRVNMDYNSAKTLSTVALVFIIIQLVGMVFIGGFYGLFFMSFYTEGGMGPDPSFCICGIIVAVIALMVPIISLVMALKVHTNIKNHNLTNSDKNRVVALVILAFLGGGGLIPAIMYIILMTSWSDLTRSRIPQAPMYGARSLYPPPPPPPRRRQRGPPPPFGPPIGERPPPGWER